MLFFLNRYELPALHAGLVSPQSPRQSPRIARVGEDPGRGDGETRGVVSPPQIQPAGVHMPQLNHDHQPPQIPIMPRISSTSPDDGSNLTAPTEPLSSRSTDLTPQSEQQSLLLPPMQHGTMRYASTSLQSIRSLAFIQSNASSLAAQRTASPNFIFQGGYDFAADAGALGDGEGEEDSYIARVMSS